MKIGFQTILWWPFRDPLEYRLEVIAAAGFQGVEFKERPDELPPIHELLKLLERHKLELIGLAGGSLERRMEFCKDFRPEYLYTDDWNEEIARLVADERFSKPRQFILALHPHVFRPAHSLAGARDLLEKVPQLKFVPDTAHLTIAGDDPVEAIKLFKDKKTRIPAVHLKDWTPEYGRSVHRYARGFAELGEGVVDLEGVLGALGQIAYDGWLVVEQDYTKTDAITSTFNGARWLVRRALLSRAPEQPPKRTLVTEQAEERWTEAEAGFLQVVVSAGWQDLESCYKSIAVGFRELLECELVTFWTCSPAHNLMSLVAVEPDIGIPLKNVLDSRQALTGETVTEQTIKHFDLRDETIRRRFGWPPLLKEVKSRWMTSIPIFNPWNPNHARLVVNVLHSQEKLRIGDDKLNELAAAVGFSTSYALDEVGSTLATQVSTLAAVSRRVKDFTARLVDFVRKALDCAEVAAFQRNTLGSRLEPAECYEGACNSTIITRWYETRKKSIALILDNREPFVMPRDWWEAVEAKDEPDVQQRRACAASPFVSADGTLLGFICCTRKRGRRSFGGSEAPAFSDDDEAILEAIVQAALPKFEMEKLLEAHQKALLCITHTIHRPLIDVVSGITYLYTKYKGQLDGLMSKWLRYIRQTTEDAQVIAGGTSRVFRALVQGDEARTGDIQVIDPVEETQRLANRMNLLEKGHRTDQPNPKRLHIVYQNRAGRSKIRADREGFLFIMYNLLDNAIKYSYKGRYIEVVYEKERGDLHIKVKSYGVCVPIRPGQEDLPFELFWRGEEQIEYQRKDAIYNPGLGVGLWVSRELARASKGEVRLVPHTEEGTEDPHYSIFLVRFPLAAEWPAVIAGL